MAAIIPFVAPSQVPPSAGKVFDQIRIERRLSVAEIAKKAGIARQTVSNAIGGSAETRDITWQRMVEAVGYGWPEFLRRISQEISTEAPRGRSRTIPSEIEKLRHRLRRIEDALLRMPDKAQDAAVTSIEAMAEVFTEPTSASESFRSARFGVAERARTPELVIEEPIVAGPGQLSLLDMVAAAEPPPEPALT